MSSTWLTAKGDLVHEGMAVGDRYRVERLLGRGGLGEVWEATDRTLGRRVAIKFISGATQYPEAAQRFAREARTLAMLRHGNIVTVHDAGTAEQDGQPLPYLVMELLDGATWEFAHVDSVVETGARVAEVLGHVHAARIVHRDVKPANIMICADGRAVLMDFGIARDDASLTRTVTATGQYFGTPAYMAPEQLQGRAATPASDVYALGIVLVEKLTGHRLPVAQLMPQVRASLREPLRSLLTRMTSAAPEQRPTAAECAAQLRAPGRATRATRAAGATGSGRLWARPTTPREWRARVLPPAVLLLLYAIVLFLPAYDGGPWSEVIAFFGEQIMQNEWGHFSYWGAPAMGTLTTLGTALGVATLLVTAVLLAPGTGRRTRLAGYAAAVLTVVCLGWQATSGAPYHFAGYDPPLRYGVWLFYLLTAVTIACYGYREVRTRRADVQP